MAAKQVCVANSVPDDTQIKASICMIRALLCEIDACPVSPCNVVSGEFDVSSALSNNVRLRLSKVFTEPSPSEEQVLH